MYLHGDDNLTPTQRARMNAIAERLHWLGVAIQQATVSGDFTTAAKYEAEKRVLQAEQKRIQGTAIATGEQRVATADDPWGILGALKGIALYAGLGLAAYLYLTRRRG